MEASGHALADQALGMVCTALPTCTVQWRFLDELKKQVVPGVNICKPVDYKGDKDGICVSCEGFAECSLRYVNGQPEEIVLKNRDGS